MLLPGRAAAQDFCADVVSTAGIDGCSVPGAEWDFSCWGGGSAESTTTPDGNCWLVTSASLDDAHCQARRDEPELTMAPAYVFEMRVRAGDFAPHCTCQTGECGCMPVSIFVTDGIRTAGVVLLIQPIGQFVGFSDASDPTGQVYVPLDITAVHTYRVEVDRAGAASFFVDGVLLHEIPYEQLPLQADGLGSIEVFVGQWSTAWFDEVTFDVCGEAVTEAERPPHPASDVVAIEEVTTSPEEYVPGNGRLTISTKTRVANVSDASPHNKNFAYTLRLTQQIISVATGKVLHEEVVTKNLDLADVPHPLGTIAQQFAWQWDGHVTLYDLANYGAVTISSYLELVRKGIIDKIVSADWFAKPVWLGPTLRAWESWAGPVFHRQLALAAGTQYTVTAVQCTTKPVVRLYRRVSGTAWSQYAKNESPHVQGDLYTAAVQVKPASAVEWLLVVHAKPERLPYPSGFCRTIELRGTETTVLARPASISFPLQWLTNPVAPGETLQTALAPGGADDTELIALKHDATNDLTAILAIDDDSGVGKASRLVLPTATDSFFLAAKRRAGTARAYLNDAAVDGSHDRDLDGVGKELEEWIGTCDSATTVHDPQVVSIFEPCAQVAARRPLATNCLNPTGKCAMRDTDADGIGDYWELFGCTADSTKGPPQMRCAKATPGGTGDEVLSAWGADPRHMDLFLEADAVDDCDEGGSFCAMDPATGLQSPAFALDVMRDWAAAFAEGTVASSPRPGRC